jgi:Methane/Phenol/Alkene Hydroxylase
MTLLNRDDWYDLSHDLDWTLSYVDEQDAFPVQWSGTARVPKEAWRSWEEPFRVSYRDYVMVQREKEAGVAGVREALNSAPIRDGAHIRESPSSKVIWTVRF